MLTYVTIDTELAVSYNGEEEEVLPKDVKYEVIARKKHDGYLTGTILVLYDNVTGISFTIDEGLTEEVSEMPWE